ncbi:vitamin B12 dependent-methionine synthase activation domain-containing protein [Bacteroidota bacterium]
MPEEKKRRCTYDPLIELMSFYKGKIDTDEVKKEIRVVSIEDKLKHRIIDGDKVGIESDLDEALKKYEALNIINEILLGGMKVVGVLFGSGQMQLPFVLQSAECMKAAVKHLEPFIDKVEGESSKGTLVLATVKGDVHDIGKNLVDIILTNNGYKVINLGIKCPIETMLSTHDEHKADAIGMSGLLVKSTTIMKDNLELMNQRNYDVPVILGGAALTKRYVEGDLRKFFKGDVYYANDAFDGLKYIEEILDYKKKGERPELRIYTDPRNRTNETGVDNSDDKEFDSKQILSEDDNIHRTITKSTISTNAPTPTPPFFGSEIVDNIPLENVYAYINETALFKGGWKVFKDKSKSDDTYKELLQKEIYPKFEELKLKAESEKLLVPKLIYGYFPCQSDGDDLIILRPKNFSDECLQSKWNKIQPTELNKSIKADAFEEWHRFKFPRQKSEKHLCISDFFKSKDSGLIDVVAFQIVTVGQDTITYSQKLFKENKYQEYLYFHGFSVETVEALAEYWHKIIRKELNIQSKDSEDIKKLFQQGYQGSRYSFGYPACPNLEDNKQLFEILKPGMIGITLTEEFQMVPEQSTNAIILHHPEARYFFIR